MRKFNTKRLTNPLRMHSEPIEREVGLSHSQNGRHTIKLDPLETLHQSLIEKEKFLLELRESTTKNRMTIDNPQLKHFHRSIKHANREISEIKLELSKHREHFLEKRNDKLDNLIDKLRDNLHHSRYSSIQTPPQQIMYPVPMPFSIPNYQQTLDQRKRSLRDEVTRESFNHSLHNDSFYLRNNKIRNRQYKADRLKKNMKRWRKVANAVLFTVLLRRFCDLMRTNRLLNFQKIKNTLGSNLAVVKKDLGKLLVPFFTILLQKKDVSLELEQDDPKDILREKVSSIKKMVLMVFESLKEWTQHASDNPKFVQMLYHLCKHGNFCCNEPILTPEELELSCINPKNKFISAEANLEAAAFINTIVIKVLTFNVLLKPSNVSQELQEDTIVSNLEIISTIVYEMAIDFQDLLMSKVPKGYPIGNFERESWVKSSESLIYNRSPKQPGQLISGLRGEDFVRKNFKTEKWEQQKKLLQSCVKVFHKMMVQFHRKISKNFY